MFQNKMSGLTGLKDVDREVLKHIDDKDLLKACSADRRMWNEVCNDNFLRRRLSKYPEIEQYKRENESWKQFFLRAIYYISKLKEEFQFPWTSGDFKKQYQFFAKNDKYNLQSLLDFAARQGELEIVKHIMKDDPTLYNMYNSLMYASYAGHLDIVKYFNEHGVDLHLGNDSALMYAVLQGHLELVKYFVENGADIHAQNDYAFAVAFEEGQLEILNYLREKEKTQ